MAPFLDQHEASVAADLDGTWSALVETLDGALAGAAATAFSRLVGCDPRVAS